MDSDDDPQAEKPSIPESPEQDRYADKHDLQARCRGLVEFQFQTVNSHSQSEWRARGWNGIRPLSKRKMKALAKQKAQQYSSAQRRQEQHDKRIAERARKLAHEVISSESPSSPTDTDSDG